MHFPPDPNEMLRLDAIEKLNLAALSSNATIDRITAFTQKRFGVPTCLLTIVGAEEQFLLSRQGSDLKSLPRKDSFCSHTILKPEVLVIPDTKTDQRFQDNPLVTGEPFMRFYAGAPLAYEGDVRLGALCLVDTKPRSLSLGERAELMMLADYAVSVIMNRALGLPEPDISAAFYD